MTRPPQGHSPQQQHLSNRKSRTDRSPLSPAFDKKQDGPNRPSV